MMRPLIPFALVFGTSLVGGCASTKLVEPLRPDPALESLQRSARAIQSSWNAVGAIDKASHADAAQLLANDHGEYGPGLSRRITMRYSGDLRAATAELAAAAGAEFKEVGQRPPTAIPIHIEAESRQIGEVLRDIAYQAGRRAGVRLAQSGGREIVELLYVPTEN